MIRFIKKILLFFVIITAVLSGMFYYFYTVGGNDLPAPAFSNSISFNEKIDFIRDKDLSRIEYIAIGSSMTLNNVDSEIMVRHLGENYINLGSWGFKISDSERFLKEMSGFFPNLKTVIISTTFVDFSSTTRNIQVDYDLIRLSVKHKLGMIPYLMNLDLRYMLNNSKTNKAKIRDSGSYDILSFDEYGGVILKIPEEAINPERWNNDITNFEVSEKELSALNELKDFLKSRNIKTVITVPPQREGLMNEEKLKLVNNEISRIQKVVLSGGGIFINSFELGVWPDSLFVDYCHLNKAGAVKYTEIVAGLIFPP
jgi:hypothetical protein